jgi:hypothetical protein
MPMQVTNAMALVDSPRGTMHVLRRRSGFDCPQHGFERLSDHGRPLRNVRGRAPDGAAPIQRRAIALDYSGQFVIQDVALPIGATAHVLWHRFVRGPLVMNGGSPAYSPPARMSSATVAAVTSFSLAPSFDAAMAAVIVRSTARAPARMHSISSTDLITRMSSTSPPASTSRPPARSMPCRSCAYRFGLTNQAVCLGADGPAGNPQICQQRERGLDGILSVFIAHRKAGPAAAECVDGLNPPQDVDGPVLLRHDARLIEVITGRVVPGEIVDSLGGEAHERIDAPGGPQTVEAPAELVVRKWQGSDVVACLPECERPTLPLGQRSSPCRLWNPAVTLVCRCASPSLQTVKNVCLRCVVVFGRRGEIPLSGFQTGGASCKPNS